MRLHFEPNLDFQHAAIESVCDLFRGQERCGAEFTVVHHTETVSQGQLGLIENNLGIGSP